VDGPVGVAEELAGEKDEVRLTVGDDGVGLRGIGDEADGGGGYVGFAADSLGELDLEAWNDGDFRVGYLAARRAIDEVDAVIAEMMSELDGFVGIPAAFRPIGSGDADKEGQVGRPLGANGVNDLQEHADAVFEAAAVVVGSLIGEGGEEFVEQVAVGGVDFDKVESSGEGTEGGQAKGLDGGGDAGVVEGPGDGVAGGKGDGRGSDRLPCAFLGQQKAFGYEGRGHTPLAAGVGELDAGASSLGMEEQGDAPQGGDMLVFPNTEVSGGDAALGGDGGGFKSDQAGAALGAGTKVHEVPVGGEAVFRGVLAHGGDADAIGELEGAEFQDREKRMSHDWLDV